MAITSQLVGSLGGGSVDIVPVSVTLDNTWRTVHTVTVTETSYISARINDALLAATGDAQWGAPAPVIRVAASTSPVEGTTAFEASLSTVAKSERENNHLNITALVPAGTYNILANTMKLGRNYPVSELAVIVTPA